MSSKDEPLGAEKGEAAGLPTYEGTSQVISKEATSPAFREGNWYTRNGLNLESFKKAQYGLGTTELDRPMKTRHLHMIAIGGSIGAGFFVGSGAALSKGGPGSVFIDFLIIGIMMFNVVYALGELSVLYPVSGGFYTYSARFIDPSWGFAMGWNYVFQWAIVLPLELTVCGLTIQYWNVDISVGVWVAVFLGAIIIINVFGALGYAEEEFWSSCFKLAATVIFMIISLVLVCGGGPSSGRYNQYWGARYWYDPGAFKNGFKGFCSVFVTAAFSFSGTELVGLAAAESKNPAKSLPGAIKQVFWRITLFYILGLFFVGLLVDSNDPALLTDNAYADVKASPFVLVGKYANLRGFDHFMNLVILVSVLSIGVSGVYGGSRTLTALAQQGYAPKLFTYIDKSGRPLPSVIFIIIFGLLAFINLDAKGPVVFDWLQALSGLAALFTWGSICLAHIRFRKAWRFHGHTLDEIPFKAAGGVYGSWLGLGLCFLVLAAQFYTAIVAPPGKSGMGTAEGFFKSYLAAPVVLFFWAGGYLWKREGWIRTAQMDVDTGRRELDWDAIHAYRGQVASWPAWRRLLNLIM
ncbi:amino acid permease [Hirsutella rhossiliensis]|uniref:Amino acid permease domain-containing protein n=1 Tax=Hirsutella rhossiliensis TaxID=111463 RepID=A0A9P8SGP2_9HYPO|nr:amino acid permease domain-containing protein [Hirsutella rhossiliensis]KAH0960710.1 amino acid permease domain-containing protein [Hirsutella rhossiliensis]